VGWLPTEPDYGSASPPDRYTDRTRTGECAPTASSVRLLVR